ncbi:MAG TPA: hypothetical protein VLX44_10295 [Xanthobacteraceae bacterium]|nr:hypothetical protein [Xanthobacteraceae bacterium]
MPRKWSQCLAQRIVDAAAAGLCLTAARRLLWLEAVIIVAFCAGLALSPHLWIGPRSYPPAPVLAVLPPDGYAAQALYTTLFVLAAAILLRPRPRIVLAAFAAIVALFCLADQTRWQPWVFLYEFLVVTLALFSWRHDDAVGEEHTLNVARLAIAGTYLWSGLQKLNGNFVDVEFPWIVAPITDLMPATRGFLHACGLAVPFVQVGFGIGLMTRRFRTVSLALAVAMHVFILAMFGPAGQDWNDVVWPWTAAMAVLDVILFAGVHVAPRDILLPRGNGRHRWRACWHVAALALFLALPALSLVNLWDSYLSAALYSGNVTEAQIYATDAAKAALPAPIARYLVHVAPDTNVINMQRWTIEDLNVTPYPETRVFRAIARSVCDRLPDQGQLVLIVKEQRLLLNRPEMGFRCWQL